MKGSMMKLKMERHNGAEKLAKLVGVPLAPHDGYLRENNGDWIICTEDGVGIIRVAFQGTAKRGEGYKSPDPVGQAMANRIIDLWNAAEQ
jgi:hypothetical protein